MYVRTYVCSSLQYFYKTRWKQQTTRKHGGAGKQLRARARNKTCIILIHFTETKGESLKENFAFLARMFHPNVSRRSFHILHTRCSSTPLCETMDGVIARGNDSRFNFDSIDNTRRGPGLMGGSDNDLSIYLFANCVNIY